MQVVPIRAVQRGWSDQPPHRRARPVALIGSRSLTARQRFVIQLQQRAGNVAMMYRRHRVAQRAAARRTQQFAPVALQPERDLRIRQRVVRNHPRHCPRLRRRPSQEATSRRQRREQIAHLYRRPRCRRRRTEPFEPPVAQPRRRRRRLLRWSRGQVHVRRRRDRGERLAAKAERLHRVQLLGQPQLRGRVPFEGVCYLVRRNPTTVIAHANLRRPTVLDRHVDPRCPGIERVLDQLFDRAGRPLDHLPSGDPRGDFRRQHRDPWSSRNHHRCPPPIACRARGSVACSMHPHTRPRRDPA